MAISQERKELQKIHLYKFFGGLFRLGFLDFGSWVSGFLIFFFEISGEQKSHWKSAGVNNEQIFLSFWEFQKILEFWISLFLDFWIGLLVIKNSKRLKSPFISSDRSSYSDSVLLLVQQLCQILSISANIHDILWCSVMFYYDVLSCSMMFYGVLWCSMMFYGVL